MWWWLNNFLGGLIVYWDLTHPWGSSYEDSNPTPYYKVEGVGRK